MNFNLSKDHNLHLLPRQHKTIMVAVTMVDIPTTRKQAAVLVVTIMTIVVVVVMAMEAKILIMIINLVLLRNQSRKLKVIYTYCIKIIIF